VNPTEARKETEARASLRLEFASDLHQSLAATRKAQEFLQAQGLSPDEAAGWRLALAEATNNVVLHGGTAGLTKPICLEIFCGAREVEALLLDSGPGFDWPARVELPDASVETSRGLFLIVTLMDHVEYHRERLENRLVLKKHRHVPGSN
jgi:serine/threonine-protein kinase RsbW